MQEQILYKAKNSKGLIFASLTYLTFVLGGVICFHLIKLKYSSLFISELSEPIKYFSLVIVVLALILLFVSVRRYFSDYFCVTERGLLIKYINKVNFIPFDNIKLIKKCKTRHSSHVLIKVKSGEDIIASSITNIQDVTNKIKECYSCFNNYEGVIEGLNNDITALSINAIIFLSFATYWGYKIFNMNIHSLGTQILWGGIIIIYISGLSLIIKLVKQIKNRYFSEETKMMLASISASEKVLEVKEKEALIKLKEQEEESVVTKYCPICGTKLIDFKCGRCEVSLDNIYDVKKFYCMNCGTKRADLEPDCINCGFSFNL